MFAEKAPSHAFIEYIDEPYTAVVVHRLLRCTSLKEGDETTIQEGKTSYSVSVLLLGKYSFCSYFLFTSTTHTGTREQCEIEQVKYEEVEDKENVKPKGQKRITQVCAPQVEILYF